MDYVVVGVLDEVLEGNDAAVSALFVEQIEIDVGEDDLLLIDGALGGDAIAREEIIRRGEDGGLSVVVAM